jgi:hypothetical protein
MSDRHEKVPRIMQDALDDLKEGNEADAVKKIDQAGGIAPEAAEEVLDDMEEDARDQYA